MIISPRNPVTKTIVNVYSDDAHVYIKFPESNDDFRELIKNRRYFWGGWENMRWIKSTKHSQDRHSEIIRLLLENGFIVDSDEEYIIRAQNREYEPEPLRWITTKDNHFRLCWYRSENCYYEARRLPASKYDKPCVIVPMEYYEEVVDFAEINGFYIYQSAKELLVKAQTKMNTILFFDDTFTDEKEVVKPDCSVHKDLLDV